jgi:asparagine synthase (glutamine-hydrolysing)
MTSQKTLSNAARFPRLLMRLLTRSTTAARILAANGSAKTIALVCLRLPHQAIAGAYLTSHPALGHARLSINDLSLDGAQPFHSPDDKIHAVVNGEFYDYDRIRKELEDTKEYVFRSRSDSEIVIALYMHYGLNFVNQLRGEFAVVLFDENEQHLIALRDRFGIKPLFWTIQEDPKTHERKLLIASEMKAFLPLGWKPDWDVRSLMDGGWNHDERTDFKDVKKVRPGHYMLCTGVGHIEQRQYWDAEYPDKKTVDHRTPEEMIEGVRERLFEAIKLRLRADVPIGIYLSGGIDSSVIAGMVTHLIKEQGITMGSAPPSERVCCFSIAFDKGSGFDESSIAERTANSLGVKFEPMLMNEAELASRFEDATYHVEHHNPDLNFVGKFALSELPAKHGYKVVLTGEGADEHFAGYPVFLPDYLREKDAAWASHNELSEYERKEELLAAEKADKAYYDAVGADTSARGPSVSRNMLNNISTVSSMVAFQPDVFEDWTTLTHGRPGPQRTIANNIDGIARQKILDKWHPPASVTARRWPTPSRPALRYSTTTSRSTSTTCRRPSRCTGRPRHSTTQASSWRSGSCARLQSRTSPKSSTSARSIPTPPLRPGRETDR